MSETTRETPEPTIAEFGLDAVRELLQLIGQTDITEILIERGDVKLHVKRGHTIPVTAPMSASATVHSSTPLIPPAYESSIDHRLEMPAGYTIAAPMVGTFYTAPSPKDPPYVQEGDEIQVGDSVGIIEAMKMMNEIESEVAGRVARILVKNAQSVEYGQPLMVIEPI